MSNNRKYTKIETWTVDELTDATSANPYGNKKVTIPEFQRRLVWSRKKQEELINSIKKGYPFGSLLMYKETDATGEMEHYKLIDGLQRTQALRRYTDHPNSSFTKTHLSDELIEFVAQELDRLSDQDCLSKQNKIKIRDVMLRWVWDSRGYTEADGWRATGLVNALISDVLELEEGTYDFYMANRELLSENRPFQAWVTDFLNNIQKESDIGKAEVPIIIFTGPSRELPTVFELLNTQGTKLTRYEVFAAQWLDYRQPIKNREIIDAIWKKYEALERHGFTLDVAQEAPDKQSRLERKYTLFEYLFGLGQHLSHKYPKLFKAVALDRPSSAGFNLMSACLGLRANEAEMRKLPEKIHGLHLTTLEAYLLEATGFVNNTLQPVLSFHPYGQTKPSHYHTELQIISMITTAFQARYNKNDLSVSKDWEDKRTKLRKHIPMYYLYDILRDDWKGSGDSKLHDIVNSERYLRQPPPTKELWLDTLNVWFNNNLNIRKHRKRYFKDEYPEYLLLRYIYAKKLKYVQTYHVKHIVPIVQLISPLSYYSRYSGPINTIGNLALIDLPEHAEYEGLTFLEYLNRRRSNGALSVGQYHDELRKYEKRLICKAEWLPSELTQRSFVSFLHRRFELLKQEFIKEWSDYISPNHSQN